jgi:NAD(P)-dependent dehydrogenase (short-subunit alcohol dehydrogenase family)
VARSNSPATVPSHKVSSDPFDLSNRRICVIGAAGGIGAALCHALAGRGAHLVCVDRREGPLGELGEALQRAGHDPELAVVDAASSEEVGCLARRTAPLQGVVNTVGVNIRRPIAELTDGDFESVLATNLLSTFFVLREFGGLLGRNGGGSIVLLSSIRATVTEPGQGAYAAAKAGVVMLAKTCAAELGPSGVRVNAIAPSLVQTPFTQQLIDTPAWAEAYREKTALKRWAVPEDIAGAAIFLLSDASAFVTGTELRVDGGWTAIDGRFDPPL